MPAAERRYQSITAGGTMSSQAPPGDGFCRQSRRNPKAAGKLPRSEAIVHASESPSTPCSRRRLWASLRKFSRDSAFPVSHWGIGRRIVSKFALKRGFLLSNECGKIKLWTIVPGQGRAAAWILASCPPTAIVVK